MKKPQAARNADATNFTDRRAVNIDDFRVNNPPLLNATDSFETQVKYLQEKNWNAESITNQLHRSAAVNYINNDRFVNPRKSPSWYRLYSRVCKTMGVDE
jgi:hypothetical protein